jgi:hypothetical protein
VSPYEPVLSSKALATFLNLPKRRQQELSAILFQLASYPSQPGDYSLSEASGREVKYILIGNYVIGFWPDDAVGELRITEIDLV